VRKILAQWKKYLLLPIFLIAAGVGLFVAKEALKTDGEDAPIPWSQRKRSYDRVAQTD